MKKFLLFAAAALAAMPMMAENLVVNGDFKGEIINNEEQAQPEGWVCAGNMWNGRVNVRDFSEVSEEDFELINPNGVVSEDDKYVSVSLYDWNSWMAQTCSQLIEMEDAGEFTFSFDYRAIITSVRAHNDIVDPVQLSVRVWPSNFDSSIAEDAEPLYDMTIDWEDGDEWIDTEWAAVTKNFNCDDDYVLVQIRTFGTSGNESQGGAGTNTVALHVTNVSLDLAGEGAVNEMAASPVKSVKYYGFDGAEIVNPVKGQLVIAKSTLENGAVKVAKKVVR